jgi:hypothetical protein
LLDFDIGSRSKIIGSSMVVMRVASNPRYVKIFFVHLFIFLKEN